MPEYTVDVVALGTVRILNALIESGLTGAKFYHASSSEMFGLVQTVPQNEKTPFYPRSPYACAKAFSHWLTVNYREAYGIHASNGILFNHESPRRGENFVTRKITRGLAKIVAGKEKQLFLGNLESKRDWGYAREYVEAMWLMLQQPKGDDYVIATGETHSIREFLHEAFSLVKLNYEEHVQLDPRHYRPTEVELLIGDARKAEKALNWRPKVRFRDLVRIMVTADLQEEGIDPRRYGLDAFPEGVVP